MLSSDIPMGATHFLPANETDFCKRPEFMRWDINFRNSETGVDVYCWYNWHQKKWCKDITFFDKQKRLQPISEFQSPKQ